MTFIEAIAKMEGFGAKPTNIPTRNNNPGDIIAGKFTAGHGAVGQDGRFAVFPDAATGFEALRVLLTNHYAGSTVREAVNRYAPPIENDTNHYIDIVCKLSGLKPETVLTKENIG
jgi:hypothetical protein